MYSDNKELKEIQIRCLDILKATVKLLDDNDLTYFLCGGTLLGAIRHEGFIPWDDDVDIAMPRKDYEKLLELGSGLIDGRYQIQHYSLQGKDKKLHFHTIQVVDLQASVMREWTSETERINLWIDVFPLDGMPKGKIRGWLHYYHYHFLQVMMQISNKGKAINVRKQRGKFQRMFIQFLFKYDVGKNWNTYAFMDKMDKVLCMYPFDNCSLISSLHGTLGKKEILRREWYTERTRLKFEDEYFYAPKEYDQIMRHYYGNYMIPSRRSYEHNYSQLQITGDVDK